MMKKYLRALAPYIAVVTFWCAWRSAWLAILAYHAQILLWNWAALRKLRLPKARKDVFLALPTVLAGPVLFVLLPLVAKTDLSGWLDTYHLSGPALLLMIPYFGLIHPVLEQIHWGPLRETAVWSHPVFAGYHMIVLSSLLALPWLIICFGVLVGASFVWRLIYHKTRGLTVVVASHILADLGVVVATWARTQ
jgi:membrane protease YdiL (CAAX protease family)